MQKKFTEKKILRSFFIRSFLATTIAILIVGVGIYFYQHMIFVDSLEKNIKSHIDAKLYSYDDLKKADSIMLKNDMYEIMEKANFLIIEAYDREKKELLVLSSQKQTDSEDMRLLAHHDDIMNTKLPDKNDIESHFFEISKHYFIQLFYPIYKNGKHIGYIEGISKIDDDVIKRFLKGRISAIVAVILSSTVLVLMVFPLIYFAYQKLNANKIELLTSNIMTLNTLGNAIALRDSDTNEHNYRVTIYALLLAQKMQLSDDEMRELIKGAFLHDVGKIGISDKILLKNGKLTDEEFEIMKEHVLKGVRLIDGNSWLEDSKDIILCHHEKYDGSGYPNGLKNSEIPIGAKIFSLVDVFDALTSKRPYKEPFSFEKSVQIIKEGSGSHFDPVVVENFFGIAKELYDYVLLKNQEELKNELDNLIRKYFL